MVRLLFQFIRQRRRRFRNFVFLVAVITFIAIFSQSFFGSVRDNLNHYWGDELIGGCIVNRSIHKAWYRVPESKEYFSVNDYKSAIAGSNNKEVLFNLKELFRMGGLLKTVKDRQSASLFVIGNSKHQFDMLYKIVSLTSGTYPVPGEVLLPDNIMYKLSIKVGDRIILYGMSWQGYPNAISLFVSGSYIYPNAGAMVSGAGMTAQIWLKDAQELADVDSDIITDIILPYKLDMTIKNELINHGFKITTPVEAFSLAWLVSLIMKVLNYFIFILLVIIIFSILFQNTKLLLVNSGAEIALFRSMGADWINIWLMVLTPMFFSLITGMLLGTLFCFLAVKMINGFGINALNMQTEIMIAGKQLELNIKVFRIVYIIGMILLLWFFSVAILTKNIMKRASINELRRF